MAKAKPTPVKKADFLRLLESNAGNISHACKAGHMARQVYYDWMKNDPEFAQAVDDISEGLIDWGESLLRTRMECGDTTAIIFFLKTKGKNRGYVERQEIGHSGSIKTGDKLTLKVIHTRADDHGNGNGNGNGGAKK